MSDSSRTKIGLFLLFVSILLVAAFLLGKTNEQAINNDSFADDKTSNKLAEISSSGNTAKFVVSASSTPIIRQQGTVKGINSDVKFEKDFETSLKIQEVPDVWFEYGDENNKGVKVEIPVKVKELIKKRWFNTLQYSYQNQNTNDREIKFNINRNLINDAAVYASKIEDLQIITPLEKRKISREESVQLMRLTANLAIERYKELQRMAAQINSPKISE